MDQVNLDEIIYQWIHDNFVNNTFYNKFLNILHILAILPLIFGIFLPYKLLKFYLVYTLFIIATWIPFDGCLLSKMAGKQIFLPLSQNFSNLITIILFLIGLFQIFNPNYSLFNWIQNFIGYLGQNYN